MSDQDEVIDVGGDGEYLISKLEEKAPARRNVKECGFILWGLLFLAPLVGSGIITYLSKISQHMIYLLLMLTVINISSIVQLVYSFVMDTKAKQYVWELQTFTLGFNIATFLGIVIMQYL
jgi:hypothetical protein